MADESSSGNAGRVSSWTPERRPDGRVEISVSYYHEESGRPSGACVSPERYLELFNAKILKWQVDGKPRPEHNPLPEEVIAFLRGEVKAAAASPRKSEWRIPP